LDDRVTGPCQARVRLPAGLSRGWPRRRLASAVVAALLALSALPGGAAQPSAAPAAPIELTPEERAWLAGHGPLRFITEPAYPPIEWFDEQGRYRGMVAEYFGLIEARLGTRIEVLRAPSWDEAMRRAQAHEVDGLTAAQPTPERSVFFDWTPPLLQIPSVVIARSGAEGDFTLEGLAGRRVAVTSGNALHEHLRADHPAILLQPQADDLACLVAVSFGRVDAAVVNMAVASYLIEQQGITNLRVAADSGRTNVLAIATGRHQPLLRSIMAKGLAAVTLEEREAIQDRWLGVQGGHFISGRAVAGWAAATLAALAVATLVVVGWSRALRRRVARATADLQLELGERRRVEEALRRSERKLAFHLDQTAVGVIEFDQEFRIAYWNPAAERIFGWTRAEAMGKGADLLMTEAQRAELFQAGGQLLQHPGAWHHVSANQTRDGRTITCEWFNTTLADDAGQVYGLMSLAVDVSERVGREEAQRRAQRLESLAVLAGGIAHDFNNLLTGILGNLSLLLTDDPPPADRLEMLTEAEAAARRAQALTRQLLTFSRGGAPTKALIDPGPLVREAALFASRGAAGACRLEIPAGLWTVEADAGQLGQVVQNLVINGLEARLDGEVDVLLANVRRPPQATPTGPCLRLRVTDHGVGIPAERLGRIFDPFYSTKDRGSGLGLAVTHSIVVRHGGQVEVHSTLGQGTTFDVFLPALPERTVEVAPPTPPTPTPAMNLRVLYMDDEEPILRLAQRTLSSAGCEVEVAISGVEAVMRWRVARDQGRPFDVVVLDLTVPGRMGGEETLSALRALDPAVRAVVSSGYSSSEVMADHRAHGFTAAITKPWTAEELRRVVAAVGQPEVAAPAGAAHLEVEAAEGGLTLPGRSA
jgi:PAS domain S-box-containing protein